MDREKFIVNTNIIFQYGFDKSEFNQLYMKRLD